MTELKTALAELAARHIAEEGLSYGQAKRKAAKQVGVAESNAAMPDNATIEAALRDYLTEFQSGTQPQELLRLRELALRWMDALAHLPSFDEPCVSLCVGAVVNGTANEHSAVHLQVFTDEDKHLELGLLDAGLAATPSEQRVEGAVRPILVLDDAGTPVVLTLFARKDYAAQKAATLLAIPQSATRVQLALLIESS